jgi:Phage major capsid protein E
MADGLSLDVFNTDAFTAISLSAAVDKIDYLPNFLDSLPGLFEDDSVRTEEIWIEERSTGAVVLQTTPRGTPPRSGGADIRLARSFKTVRIADSSRVWASELQNIRAFGTADQLQSLQIEVQRRQQKIKRNLALTWENLKLGCVQGAVYDADGTTLIYDWAQQFNQTIPAEVNFDLENASPASGALRKVCSTAVRSIRRGLKGQPFAKIVGICGDAFWDDLTSHPEVRETYKNWAAAADLRNALGAPWSGFRYGEIEFVNYRGTDDNSTVAVGSTKCKMFPLGSGIFRWAMSPGERFEFVNTPGQKVYSAIVLDQQRNTWADVEEYSYPLPVCTMPQALYRAKNTSGG